MALNGIYYRGVAAAAGQLRHLLDVGISLANDFFNAILINYNLFHHLVGPISRRGHWRGRRLLGKCLHGPSEGNDKQRFLAKAKWDE